jgi:hypothetical protein
MSITSIATWQQKLLQCTYCLKSNCNGLQQKFYCCHFNLLQQYWAYCNDFCTVATSLKSSSGVHWEAVGPWAADTWSADRGLSPFGPILGLEAARWAPMSCTWVRACLESVWMLWSVRKSLWTRLIRREYFTSDWWRVTLLMGCILLSFPSISNLHTNVHQHFVEFVSNNSYH